MRPFVATLWMFLISASLSARARADADQELMECADAAISAFESAGAHSPERPRTLFLVQGESHSQTLTLRSESCVAFTAIGHQQVRDLDLFLYTISGVELARDVALDGVPYVRFCGSEGVELAVTVNAYRGQGEVALLRFDDAPARMPDLNRTFGRCFSSRGGVRRAQPDIGPEPGAADVHAGLAVAEQKLRELGYRRIGTDRTGSLTANESAEQAIGLVGNRCYAVVLSAGTPPNGLEFLVLNDAGRPQTTGRRMGHQLVARLCAQSTGTYQARVRLRRGSGHYALRVFELEEPTPRVVGVQGMSRLAYAEMRRHLESRGFTVEPVTWGLAWPGAPLTVAVELSAGECYAFGAIPGPELEGGGLSISLLDGSDTLLSQHDGRSEAPITYHCAEQSGTHRMVVDVRGQRGRFLLLRGGSQRKGSR